MDKTINVGSFPFKVTLRMIGGPDVGVKEELTGIGVWPVVWNCEFGLSSFDGCDELFEGAVFTD